MSEKIELIPESELWRSKRWLFTALVLTFMAGVILQRLDTFFEPFFLENEGVINSLVLAIAFSLFLAKAFYVFQRHFLMLDRQSVSHFVWFSDLIFVALFFSLFMTASITPLTDSVSDPQFKTHLFPFFMIGVYTSLVLWSIYRWLFARKYAEIMLPFASHVVLHAVSAIAIVATELILSGRNVEIMLVVSAIMIVSTLIEFSSIARTNRLAAEGASSGAEVETEE